MWSYAVDQPNGAALIMLDGVFYQFGAFVQHAVHADNVSLHVAVHHRRPGDPMESVL